MAVVLCHGFYQSMRSASEPPDAGGNDQQPKEEAKSTNQLELPQWVNWIRGNEASETEYSKS
jgi:hypothetical protein